MRNSIETQAPFCDCPIRNVVSRFGDKWSILVLVTIQAQGVIRFSELSRQIPDVSSRVLSSTLKTLEADGLINRKSYPVVPPKVEYSLTPIGESLMPILTELTQWALLNMPDIKRHRTRRVS